MAGETTCNEPGCEGGAIKRGMCNRHYLRWWKHTPPEERSPTPLQEDVRTRFEKKVRRRGQSDCWEWLGAKRPSGHGEFAYEGRNRPAAAVALILAGQPRSEERPWALHRCDNPVCVNPRHLYWGTPQDNVDDAWARGRLPHGSARYAAKLNERDVLDIRMSYAGGVSGAVLARRYGIAKCSVYQITSGNKWKSVGGPITQRRTEKASKRNGK